MMKVLAQPRQHHKLYFDTKTDCLTLKTRKYNFNRDFSVATATKMKNLNINGSLDRTNGG